MPYPVAAIRNRNFGVALPFMGAYDAIPNIVAAYSMRRLRTAYTGSILRVRRSSDNTEQDIGYESDGDLDTAAIATFIGGGSGYVVKWYDQSGNAYDASQTTAASQPLYVASGQNGRSVMRWDGVDDIMPTLLSSPAVFSFIAVVKKLTQTTDAASLIRPFLSSSVAPSPGGFQAGTVRSDAADPNVFGVNPWDAIGITATTTLWTDGTTAVLSAVLNGASSLVAYNAVVVTGTINNTVAGVVEIGGSTSITVRRFAGDIAELIICNAALSAANRQAAEVASNNYWAVY